jgi:hypothetical protein
MAITKLLMYDNRPDDTGESHIYMVEGTGGGLTKTASNVHPDTLAAIASLPEATEDNARALITALSAYEPFGPNKNGDGFYEDDLVRINEYGNVDGEPLNIPMYRSFERFAKPYRHHINKPDSPSYGRVLRSIWNDHMSRVELIVEVARRLAPDIVEAIEKYEPVSTSMGFRAKYDECSVCGNKAKTRRQYCHHLRRQMLQVLPNGHHVHARNPYGKFFDISFVIDPADVTSRAVAVGRLPVSMDKAAAKQEVTDLVVAPDGDLIYLSSDLAKVAGYGDQEPTILDAKGEPIKKEAADKKAEETKEGDIMKKLDGLWAVHMNDADIDRVRERAEARMSEGEQVKKAALDLIADNYPLDVALSTFGFCGISLSAPEAQYLALRNAGMPKTAERLGRAGIVIIPERIEPSDLVLGVHKADVKLASAIAGDEALMTSRSHHLGWALERLDKTALNGHNPFLRARMEGTPNLAAEVAMAEEMSRVQQVKQQRRGILSYLIDMLIGAQWKREEERIQRILRENPEIASKILGGHQMRGAHPRAIDRVVPRQSGDPDTHARVMMSAPIAYYIRGTENSADIYKTAGIGALAMSRDEACRSCAEGVLVRAIAHPLFTGDTVLDKTAMMAHGPDALNAQLIR